MDASKYQTDDAHCISPNVQLSAELHEHPVKGRELTEGFEQKFDQLHVYSEDDQENLDANQREFNHREELINVIRDICKQNEDGDNYLHRSIIHQRQDQVLPILKVLRAAEIPDILDSQNHKYQTALHLATYLNQPAVVELLLRCGASVDIQTDEESTALHIACEYGHLELVRLLCQVPHNSSITNDRGESCLYTAARHGHTAIVYYLVNEAGHDINTQELYGGQGLLHLAIKRREVDSMEFLLDHPDLDPDMVDSTGWKVSSLALYYTEAFMLFQKKRPDLIAQSYDELSSEEE